VPEVALEFFVGIRRYTKRVNLNDLRIKKRLGVGLHVLRQRGYEILGLPAAGSDEYVVTAPNVTEYLVFTGKLLRINFLPVIKMFFTMFRSHRDRTCLV
jgi:hypothetical protein